MLSTLSPTLSPLSNNPFDSLQAPETPKQFPNFFASEKLLFFCKELLDALYKKIELVKKISCSPERFEERNACSLLDESIERFKQVTEELKKNIAEQIRQLENHSKLPIDLNQAADLKLKELQDLWKNLNIDNLQSESVDTSSEPLNINPEPSHVPLDSLVFLGGILIGVCIFFALLTNFLMIAGAPLASAFQAAGMLTTGLSLAIFSVAQDIYEGWNLLDIDQNEIWNPSNKDTNEKSPDAVFEYAWNVLEALQRELSVYPQRLEGSGSIQPSAYSENSASTASPISLA